MGVFSQNENQIHEHTQSLMFSGTLEFEPEAAHRLVHRVGNEAAWWKESGIDPMQAARKLWKRTRLVEDRSHSKDTKDVAADRTSEPQVESLPGA
jgi:hypothetical protein